MERETFRLAESVFLVAGAKRAAIYNLADGRVYSIDAVGRKLLEFCERGIPLETISVMHSDVPRNASMEFLTRLVNARLGTFCASNEAVRVRPRNAHGDLTFIWLELTAGCNLRCIHCYAQSSPARSMDDRLTEDSWRSVINQAALLGCTQLQFIGGEPLLKGNELKSLIIYAKNHSFTFIEVFTNATIFNDAMLRFLARERINVAVSLYGRNAETHDRITRKKGSFSRTVEGIKRMLAEGITVRAGITALSLNQDGVLQTQTFLHELGVASVKIDIVRPSGRGENHELMPTTLPCSPYLTKPSFPPCTERLFFQRCYGHNCFCQKVCIGADGNVYPCVMERDFSYGNVLVRSLRNILCSEMAERMRFLSKDHVEVCKDCEYRYACFDCRVRAKNTHPARNLYAKPSECRYNPYEGVWVPIK